MRFIKIFLAEDALRFSGRKKLIAKVALRFNHIKLRLLLWVLLLLNIFALSASAY